MHQHRLRNCKLPVKLGDMHVDIVLVDTEPHLIRIELQEPLTNALNR
jgi:hypothetical protein